MTTIAWFRRDLRLDANPILTDGSVVPLFVVDPRLPARGPRWDELVARLHGLDAQLVERGGRLRVEVGDPADVVPRVASETRAERVAANADVSDFARRRDRQVGAQVDLELHWANHVHAPERVLKPDGTPYRVFTPYHRTWQSIPNLIAETMYPSYSNEPGAGLPGLGSVAPTDSSDAWRRATRWLDEGRYRYASERDRVDRSCTSEMSVDLKFGSLSASAMVAALDGGDPGSEALVRQLAWRDFWAQQMWHGLGKGADERPWRSDPVEFEAWSAGRTGIPIVDAAMRQLALEGRMHGRLRMISASFLVKHLLIDWRSGEAHFREHLRDGDIAQNVGNWRWTAGVGPGSAPWHRVMNPVLQARRHDPEGDFVRRWLPELGGIEGADVHAPWELPPDRRASIDYPEPLVDLSFGRQRALAAR